MTNGIPERNYFRCRSCLVPVAVDGPPPRGSSWAACDCGGTRGWEHMGRVHRDRLVHDHLEVPCDARCTNAKGPSCDCPCGGENHGTRLLVAVVVDAGGVPRVAPGGDLVARRFVAARTEELIAAVYEARRGLPGAAQTGPLPGAALVVLEKRTMKARERAAAESIRWATDLEAEYAGCRHRRA